MEIKGITVTGKPEISGSFPTSGSSPTGKKEPPIGGFPFFPDGLPATSPPDLGELSWHGGKPVIRMAESIPARVAGIAWRWDDAGVHDVIVCRMRTPTGVTREWLRATEGPRGRMYTGGACYSDWMRPGKYNGWGGVAHTTPEGTFGSWLQDGFTSPVEAIRAVAELAKITECRWARAMLMGVNTPEVQP